MNEELLYFFYNAAHTSPFAETVVILTGVWLIFALAALLPLVEILSGGRQWRSIVVAFVSGFFSLSIAAGIAFLFPVQRPFLAHSDTITPLFTVLNPIGSFPSGHTAAAAGFVMALIFLKRPIGFVLLLGALAVGAARIAAGVHYPVDVAAGFLLGGAVASIIVRISAWFDEEARITTPAVPMH